MTKKDYDSLSIDITDVFAFILKKMVLIIVMCTIGALIGVGFHYLISSSEKAMDEYSIVLNDYNSSLSSAKSSLVVLQNKRNAILEAQKEDPVMDIYNSGSSYLGTISFLIRSDDDLVVSDSGVILYPNQERLTGYFDSIDLCETLKSDSKQKYLKAIVKFSAKNNVGTIIVYNVNQEKVSAWGESIFEVLQKYSEEQGWRLIKTFESFEVYSGQYLLSIVEEYNKSIKDLDKELYEQTRTIRDLEGNKPSPFHFVRYGIMGFVLGGFFCIIILLFEFLQKNTITQSYSIDKRIGIPFLGALFASCSFFEKLARKIIGERKYSSEADAVEFIRGNIRNTSLKEESVKNVAILCSCKSKDVEKQANTLESVLSEFGCKATLVSDVSVNPESADVVSSTDAVILLERQWVSQWKLVGVSMDLAERFNKPVVGFVLC